MLTSPVAVLLAWGGVAALLASPRRLVWRPAAALLALALAGGVLASDALQYHSSDLAPTARYQELASLNSRFAGKGPTLFTDFDEYSMYELRDLDVGGPDFAYPPAALARLAGGHGDPVELDRAPPAALAAYPLIITRRDPAASRPPSAYTLVRQGAYYQVWKRRPGAPAALAHVALSGSPSAQCARIGSLARQAGRDGAQLIGAESPELIGISLAGAAHPTRWGRQRQGLVMSTPGRLSAAFALPASGVWDVWVQGQIMPTIELQRRRAPDRLDRRAARRQLARARHRPAGPRPARRGAPPRVGHARRLQPGRRATAARRCSTRSSSRPPAADPQGPLRVAAPALWRTLCGRQYEWIEIALRVRLVAAAVAAGAMRLLRGPRAIASQFISIGAPT